ncbi:MAG: serine hydrolase, partial [Myxococcaceae bacterium]
ALKLRNTRMFRKVGKYPKAPDQNEKDFGLGKTTARDAAALLESIERCDLKDRALCNKMLTMLIQQQYRTMTPRYLELADEERASIANKVGQLNQTRNDVALVYSAEGPFVISVFTTDNADARWTCENEAEQLIGKMTKLVVETWSPQGLRPGGPPQLETPE